MAFRIKQEWNQSGKLYAVFVFPGLSRPACDYDLSEEIAGLAQRRRFLPNLLVIRKGKRRLDVNLSVDFN